MSVKVIVRAIWQKPHSPQGEVVLASAIQEMRVHVGGVTDAFQFATSLAEVLGVAVTDEVSPEIHESERRWAEVKRNNPKVRAAIQSRWMP